MRERLGERLVGAKQITGEQLRKALEHQRLNGGRLGRSLVSLGFISEEDLPAFFQQSPPVPRTLEETGLSQPFLTDLVLKHAVQMEEFRIPEMSERVKLPSSVVDRALEALRRDRFIEVKGAGQISKLSYVYGVTDMGRGRGAEMDRVSRYLGPAPVPFADYCRMVEIQTVKSILVNREAVAAAFGHLTVSEALLGRIGPAVSSGKAIFLYGPSGNGKTTIAETIGNILPGSVYVPHAVLVGGEIITVYDRVSHRAAEGVRGNGEFDQRWVLVRRPVVMVGGELTLSSLDLDFNTISKYYEAPLQMKANNGLFIIDDFGRQQVDPQRLLNRWIVPLERRADFLTLHTGMKFEVPFDQLVIFSTNIQPKKLVDEAFLRRIRYKIRIDHPGEKEYEAIFRKVCQSNGIPFSERAFRHLVEKFYRKGGTPFNACHPRDLVDQIIDNAHYQGGVPEISERTLSEAWENYFVEL